MSQYKEGRFSRPIESSADLILQATECAENLSDVLESEYRALIDRDVVLINSLTEQKGELLDSLARLEPHLRVAYNNAEFSEEENTMQLLLQTCSQLNTRNHSLVLMAIDQNRKSLSLLRNILQLDQTSVYSANGELHADRSKRYLGNA